MAVPRPCAEGPCCSRPSAALGVQQTLDEMDFERGEAGARPYRPGAFRRPQAPRAKEVAENRGPEGEAARGPSRSVGGRWAHCSRVVRARQGPGGSSALETPARVQIGNQALVSGTFPSGAAGPGSSPGATPGHPVLLPGLLLGSRVCGQGIAPTPRGWSFRPGGLRVGHCRREIWQRWPRGRRCHPHLWAQRANSFAPDCPCCCARHPRLCAQSLALSGFSPCTLPIFAPDAAQAFQPKPLSCGTVLRTLGIPQMG